MYFFPIFRSLTLRHHFRSRDNDHPADDVRDGQVPRHLEQRPGIHEASRSPKGFVRTRHGLRRLHLVHDKGNRPRKSEWKAI